MPLHSFFCSELSEGTVALPPEESRHASKVLRLNSGDAVRLMNGAGLTALACIASVSRRGDEVICDVTELQSHPRPEKSIRLYVAPPRAKIMDLLIRFATELGVCRISPVLCRYAVSKPEVSKENWRQVGIVACKQSGNPWLPEFDAPVAFNEALASSEEFPVVGMVPRNRVSASLAENIQNIGLWIGPEGGFAPEEENAFLERNAYPLTVGPCILRVETAVPALLGALYGILERKG